MSNSAQKVRKLLKLEFSTPNTENGKTSWTLPNGDLHRDLGPAVIWKNGKEEWYQYGKRHRTNGPAIIEQDQTEEYWVDGARFRKDEFSNWIHDEYAED